MGQTAQNDFFTESYVWNDIIYDIAYVNCLGGGQVLKSELPENSTPDPRGPCRKNSTPDPELYSTPDPMG